MRIILNKKIFADAVHTVGRFAERGNATLAALGAILIIAGDDGIKLRATNLETSIDLAIEGEKKVDGVVAIPASLLQQVASSLAGEGSLELEHTGDIARVTSGAGKSTLKTVPYEDFPVLPFPESSKNSFTLAGAVLKNLLVSIASCASTSTVRPELASIYFALAANGLTAVATDSFRLAEKKLPLVKSTAQAKLLVPAKNAIDIATALPDDEVTVIFDEHQCAFVWKGGRAVSRLTNANYPDYTQIIPKEKAAEATVLRKDFELALKRATVFSDSFQKVRLGFEPKQKALALFAKNPDLGESTESVAANLTGSALELSFNYRYLAAALSLTSAESIVLAAAGVGRPLTIRGAGDNSFLYLVSPMNQ